ncbi:MAG: tRNA epoxyqueuosine(34) reductase QueG [Terriglobia bacterium]
MLSSSTIKRRALEVGFDLVGVAPGSTVKDLQFLPGWLKQGFGGEMRYLADPKREDPTRVLPSVKSIICAGLVYNTPFPYSTEVSDSGVSPKSPNSSASAEDARSRAWISRYAWGRDYHDVMRSKLERLRTALETLAPAAETRVYVDTGPIVERAFARLTGMGWMGKNTCLINEQKGSWFFLGVILTNLDLEADLPAPDRCGSCTRCLEACPTGALVEPYVMDASRCISYFNIELRGSIPETFRAAIGRNVFGCDICQDVCPWNGRPLSLARGPLHPDVSRAEPSVPGSSQGRSATTELSESRPLQVEVKSREALPQDALEDEPRHQISTLEPFSLFSPSLEDLSAITEEDFRRIFARSPIKRVKYRGWLRNLCVVMGNSGDRNFIPWLEAKADHPDLVVREHAAWALHRLQGGGRS